jgi:hypothetical protein
VDRELTGRACDGASGLVARGVGRLLEGGICRARGERDGGGGGSAYRGGGVGMGDGAVREWL